MKSTTFSLFILCKNTKFQSNSQLAYHFDSSPSSCLSSAKIQNFKAIHNDIAKNINIPLVVYPLQKYKISKQFTTLVKSNRNNSLLFILCKNTKFQSNSQRVLLSCLFCYVVYPLQKYKISKQFTTILATGAADVLLFILCKNTKFQSNSQRSSSTMVSTTCCLSSAKIQNFKAIHNWSGLLPAMASVVYPLQKYKISKQFTT